jgi:hypothetical protein
MEHRTPIDEEHELPSIEAMLGATLALMTGYSQALQAALNPEQRLLMGARIGHNLALLSESGLLSSGFRAVLGKLQQRWMLMTACTAETAPAGLHADTLPHGTHPAGAHRLH